MQKKLGCLSITATIIVLITVAAIAGALYTGGNSIFSAGNLNAQAGASILGGVLSHAEIGGQCELCHAAPWSSDSMADRCMACHTQISAELASSESLHGIFLQAQTPVVGFQFRINSDGSLLGVSSSGSALKCNACHPDHRGANASLIQMDPTDFSHDNLNFSLKAHQQKSDGSSFACADCHAGKYTNPFDVATCVNCHYNMQADFTQKHALEFDLNCLNCHDGLESYGAKFDHNLFPFTLTGKHVQAACADCHKNARTTIADLRTTPQDCYACHQADDNHQGLFGTNCAVCHSLEGWKPAKIDHNFATFPLEGKHTEVACEKCHANNVFAGTPKDCFSCHQQADRHNGQLGTTCEACHSPAGWNQVHIDHSLFAFPLTGAHVDVTCESCHVNGIFKGTPQDCYACHQKNDNHKGQFGTNCATCHSTSAWKPASFDHNLSAFKLTGAHTSVACTSCHVNGVFKGTPQNCYACHRNNDKHNGQFGTNCAACHTTSSWKSASFDHNLAAFKLTGAHTSVACTSCHQNGVYKGTPQNCYACHQNNDKHNGQFGTNCASCHTTSTWKGATFNHNLSGFPLTGRHASLACSRCHSGGYSGTPTACVACHSDPAFHSGMFGTNCANCHSTSNWSATYRGSHPGIADEGGSGVNHGHTSCRTCHVSTLRKAVCTACHDGDGGGDDDGGDDD